MKKHISFVHNTRIHISKFLWIILIANCIIFPTNSYAISGTINFTGIDWSETGDTVTDGQTGSVCASDIAGIVIDIFGSNDKTTKIGKFIYLDFQNVITPSDVPSYTYNYIVIKSRDGSNFSLQSIYINNCNMTEDAVYVEGRRDGSSQGTVNLTLDAGGMPTQFNSSNGLTPSIFQNIDEVVISSNTPSAEDITAGIGSIQIGDPVLPTVVLAADTTGNSVDNDLEITYAADVAFEIGITGVSYNGNTLTVNQYTVSSGKVTLKPSVGDNTYLRTPGTADVVITASGYGNSTVSQTIQAGAVETLEVATQPVPGAASGNAFATQPVLKLKDQYGNYCTTGVSAAANVVATAKSGTGSWSIGGTATKGAVAGTATFTDLVCTLTTTGNGSMTFTSGIKTVDSSTFTIPQNGAKALTADTTSNSVDNDLEITFVADAAFENAITGVTYNGNTLTANQYTVSSGKVTLKPSVGDNTYLRTPDTANVVITASGYGNSTVSQTIQAGVVETLEVTTQPVPGGASGDAFAAQPVVKLKDQYGNYCTTGISATANVVATAKSGTGSWSIGGTTTKAAMAGTATFTDLTCTLTTTGNGNITFTSGIKTVDSSTFTIPQNVGKALTADTTGNSVDNDLEITFAADAAFESAITGVSYNANTLTANQYTVSSGKVTLKPSVGDNTYLQTPGTANVVVTASGYGNSIVSQTINHGAISDLTVIQNITAPVANGGQFAQQPIIALTDQYGNTCTWDNSTEVTASKKDSGKWTLVGTTTGSAVNGVVIFNGLAATNGTQVINAQLAFNSGVLAEVTSAMVTLPAPQKSSGTSSSGSIKPTPKQTTTPTSTPDSGVEILVNEKKETAATVTTKKEGDKLITTITLDDKRIEEKLQTEGNNTTVTIPVKNDADVVVGRLSGETVKNMERKEAVLEIKTENVIYTLPASQINIDNVSEQIGEQVELKDIEVNVAISAPPQDTVDVVQNTANKNNYQVVVKPIEFNITCSSGNKTVEVSKFNGYVARTVAIPEGIDPSRVTTGIVLNSDGTFSHVPTAITIINGKHYAKINSLNNSTYTVIYSPKTFKDVENHWAKDAVNDMGSRLIISGVSEDRFEPDGDITRAEFAAIVVRALGVMRAGAGRDAFSDVTKDAWYYDAVSIAYEHGIISGYGNGIFGPMDKITNEQAMTMFARAMSITDLKANLKADEAKQLLAAFPAFEESSEWAKGSITDCIKAGIVSETVNKMISPKHNITRAEVAVIVRRLLQKSNLIN